MKLPVRRTKPKSKYGPKPIGQWAYEGYCMGTPSDTHVMWQALDESRRIFWEKLALYIVDRYRLEK